MNLRLLCCSLSILLATSAHAADSYTIDPAHTWPMFEVNHLGFSTQRGRFDKSSGKVTLDIAAKQGSVELVIETASLDMGFDKWNKHMQGGDFFNAVIFPTMRFASDKLIFDGDKPVAAEGMLTLLGISKPVTLTISDFRCGTHPMLRKEMCGANVSTTIKRSDFGMKKFIPAVGDEVKIYSPVEAYKD
ncbi:MAG TPA: YceI family protein [Sideroxyarcus sp.]|nr:YceI family protein [Sideroxyarcus sp.]